MIRTLRRLRVDKGATAVEYGLILAMIVLAMMAVAPLLFLIKLYG